MSEQPLDERVQFADGTCPNKGKTNLCKGCGGDPTIATGEAAIGTPGCTCSLNIIGRLRAEILGEPSVPSVPWRSGLPQIDVIRAHMQQHLGSGVIAAYFQVRELGLPPAIVHAVEMVEGRLSWGYMLPAAKGEPHMGGGRIVPGDDWQFRPIDIVTGDPRAWRDSTKVH